MLFSPNDSCEKQSFKKCCRLLLKCYVRTNAPTYIKSLQQKRVTVTFSELEQTYFSTKQIKICISIKMFYII